MRHALILAAISLVTASAQQTGDAPREMPDRNIVASMPAIAQALGVTCNYCHVARRGTHMPEPKKDIARQMIAMTREINLKVQAATGKPPDQTTEVRCVTCHRGVTIPGQLSDILIQPAADKGADAAIARQMIAMTREINLKVQAATGKPPDETTEVRCVTCHRGVTIPGQLSDILIKTAADKGADAAIAQYRDLRARHYGRQSYDFGEDTLLILAQRLGYRDASEAIAVLQVNLEFNPKSVRTYSQLATAYSQKLDDKTAIATLEKALEIEPDNPLIRGQLAQLKSYKRNRQ